MLSGNARPIRQPESALLWCRNSEPDATQEVIARERVKQRVLPEVADVGDI